jgi:aspartate carbamoyltransferase catalytic subunit
LVVGLAFLEPSLRTQFGFAAAAARLGWTPLFIQDQRPGREGGPAESLGDTIRTLAGYVDLLVLRQRGPISELAELVPERVALLNAGDGGDRPEHPSQAVLDVFAIEELSGPLPTQRVVVCGDLAMRSARSLISLFDRRPPQSLVLVSDRELPGHPAGTIVGVALSQLPELQNTNILYVAGIPHGVPEEVRRRLRVDRHTMDLLPRNAVVLSPMPVIDEVSSAIRADSRIRMFEQSDLGLPVRMALLELLAGELSG